MPFQSKACTSYMDIIPGVGLDFVLETISWYMALEMLKLATIYSRQVWDSSPRHKKNAVHSEAYFG